MDYSIIESDSIAILMQKVNGYIQIGWRPVGGVSAVRPRINGPIMYHQAVLKNNSSPGLTPSLPIRHLKRQPRGPYNKKSNDPSQSE